MTKNFRSIFFTTFLAIILVYLFSIVGFVFFQDDFIIEAEGLVEGSSIEHCDEPQSHMLPACSGGPQQPVESSQKERSCDSLAMCIVTTLNQGEKSIQINQKIPKNVILLDFPPKLKLPFLT